MISLRTRRGLSTVVTSTILISAVAVIGIALVGWSNSKLTTFETGLSNTYTNMTNEINEKLSIENVAFCNNCGKSGSKNIMNVTLTNTGTLSVSVTGFQVNSTTIALYYYSSSYPYSSSSCPPPTGTSQCLPAVLVPKQSYLISANLTSSHKTWTSKAPQTITVTTARGTIFTTQVASP